MTSSSLEIRGFPSCAFDACSSTAIPITYEHRCSRCLTVQDHWGDHAVNCARTPGVKQRHERLVHALGHLLSLANIRHSVNDSNVEFLGQDSQGNLRPADILIPNWNGERSLHRRDHRLPLPEGQQP